MKSHWRAVSATENPLSRPLTSMPHPPSPREAGWVPPASRTALRMIWAQAAIVSCGARAAVDRHLVGDEPAADRLMPGEPADHLGGEPRLAGDHPDVGVEVAPGPPGRIPVLPGHVADQEGGHRGQARLRVPVQEVAEPGGHVLVDAVRLRHEIRPVEERPGHGQPVRAKDPQFGPDGLGVVVPPHQRAARPGPEVDPEPTGRPPPGTELGGVPVHAEGSSLRRG